MKFKAHIDVMPLDELLDPQGKVITSSLHKLNMTSIENVRIGKHITIEVEAGDESSAKEMVENACKKLLANEVIEKFDFHLEKTD